MSKASDEDKVATVRRFSDQMMSAVLDGNEILLFDRIEQFFGSRAEAHYKQGYQEGFLDGWASCVETSKTLLGGTDG